MGATAILRRDHQILRAELRLLEAMMQVAPEASSAVGEMCGSLAEMLDEHVRRETSALKPYARTRANTLTRDPAARGHADQRVMLRDVEALLCSGSNVSVSGVAPSLAHLSQELQEQMVYEEQTVFPLVDQIAGDVRDAEAERTMVVLG